MKFFDDQGEELTQSEVRERVANSIEELESLLRINKGFLADLDAGTLERDRYFMDFTRPLTNGYSVTGPAWTGTETGED